MISHLIQREIFLAVFFDVFRYLLDLIEVFDTLPLGITFKVFNQNL